MLKDIDELNCLIGQILNKRIEPSAFCWRPSWASRFESLWSLLRKFAYLNAITHREVRRLFGYDDADPTRVYWKHCLRSDLRHCGALDPSKIAIILGINYKDLAEAVVLRYVNEYEAATLSSEFLRFCPTCINQGFHSSLHQLLLLTKCPAHGDKLQSRCTECLTLNIPYNLQSISDKDLLRCAHMLNGLKQHLTHSNMEVLRKEAANRARALLPEAKLLMTRVKINTPEELVSQWVPQGTGRRHFARYIKKLPGYWADVFIPGSFEGSFNISKHRDTHVQIRSREFSFKSDIYYRHGPIDFTDNEKRRVWNDELYKIYKSIRRHFIRNYLSRHRRCFNKARTYTWWDEQHAKGESRICPAVNAVLLWCCFYVNINSPEKLFMQPNKWWTPPRFRWNSPSDTLPENVIRRIFALESVGIFKECLLLAEAHYRRNTFPLYVVDIKGRRKPHWLVEESEGGWFTIHWWVSKTLSLFFGNFYKRSATACSDNK